MDHSGTPARARRGHRAARLCAALGVAALLSGAALTPAHGAARKEVTGLWPTTFEAGQSAADCGQWKLDANGFCVADDVRNGLEVGVKFQTSRAVVITGVRIYRVDTSTLTGSLWNASGERLATGRFAPGPASAWQDMSFDAPVTVVPGQTYVASYFTPKTKYAFRYGYFADSGRTVGPITAQRSTSEDPNGVHCYEEATCGSFPVRGYRDSAYWVTPLWAGAPDSTTPGPTTTSPGATPPRVVRVGLAKHTAGRPSKVQVTFSAPMRRSTFKPSAVRLRGPDGPVATRLSYDAAHRRLVLTPARRLQPRTTYRVVVTTRVEDTQGNRFDQNPSKAGAQKGTWAFRTP